MKLIRVAIDGPSGAGKSTLAREAAGALGYLYVDTGAIYRTVGCHARRTGTNPGDEAAVLALLPETDIRLIYGADGLQRMLLNGDDVTEEIRLPEISAYASTVSAYPGVRAFLLEMQRKLARENSVIMDGRELEARGTPEPYEKVLSDIRERDWRDIHREAAPLRQAEDAVVLDTTALTFEKSREALLKIIGERVET